MNDAQSQLERLISRFLDDEATRAERRELKAALRNDPCAEALFEETAALDREAGYALRRATGRTIVMSRRTPMWLRVLVPLAAAACLGLLAWLGPKSGTHTGNGEMRQAGWFAPPRFGRDTLDARPQVYERPHVRLRDTKRNWIVIPGERPGEFMVIEVDRVQTRVLRIQRDF